MNRKQVAYAAAFAAVIFLSLLLVRPRGGRSTATATTTSTAATASPAAPRPAKRASGGLRAKLSVSPAKATTAPPAEAKAAVESEPAAEPPLTGAVAGAVRDALGAGMGEVTVVAVSADGHDAAETLTDDDGSFLLPGLLPGRYAVFSGLGTPLAARIGGRGVEVRPAAVARVDLLEPASGTVVRVAPHDAAGHPTDAQAVLVTGAPDATGAVGSLLGSDAIYLPELGGGRTVLPRVPPGVYTLVLLRGADVPARAARNPVRIASEREVVVDIVVASAASPRR